MLNELPPEIRAPIAISLGAIGGALCRYYLTLWFAARFGVGWPYGTFVINVTGCFGMGLLTTWINSPEWRLLLLTGFLGAYTTFSTYGLESFSLLRQNQLYGAGLYWLGSSVVGLFGVAIGVWFGAYLRDY
jgi:fluoride exporter